MAIPKLTDATLLTVHADLVSAHEAGGRQIVMPPTYSGARGAVHNHTPLRPDGTCEQIVIDSPQSFANRVEERLSLIRDIPRIEVAVGERVLDSFGLPHRVFDAILRDSEDDGGTPFRATQTGKNIVDPAVLVTASPNVLLFGGWDSHGQDGGGGRKFASAITVQIVGTNGVLLQDAGSRVDPLAITIDAAPIYLAEGGGWTLDSAKANRDEKGNPLSVKPSEIGHGNIAPSLTPKGALVDQIVLTGGISVSRLRRYLRGGLTEAHVEALAAMGVFGVMDTISDGLDLRSGCELSAKSARWKVCSGIGEGEELSITRDEALEWMLRSLKAAGLAAKRSLRFHASKQLLALVAGASPEKAQRQPKARKKK